VSSGDIRMPCGALDLALRTLKVPRRWCTSSVHATWHRWGVWMKPWRSWKSPSMSGSGHCSHWCRRQNFPHCAAETVSSAWNGGTRSRLRLRGVRGVRRVRILGRALGGACRGWFAGRPQHRDARRRGLFAGRAVGERSPARPGAVSASMCPAWISGARVWVGSGGTLFDITGGIVDGHMRMQGTRGVCDSRAGIGVSVAHGACSRTASYASIWRSTTPSLPSGAPGLTATFIARVIARRSTG
jgi:hypothetical protein